MFESIWLNKKTTIPSHTPFSDKEFFPKLFLLNPTFGTLTSKSHGMYIREQATAMTEASAKATPPKFFQRETPRPETSKNRWEMMEDDVNNFPFGT